MLNSYLFIVQQFLRIRFACPSVLIEEERGGGETGGEGGGGRWREGDGGGKGKRERGKEQSANTWKRSKCIQCYTICIMQISSL